MSAALAYELLLLHVAGSLAAGLLVLWVRRHGRRPTLAPPGVTRALLATAVAVLVAMVQTAVLRNYGLKLFGAVHLMYAVGGIVLPGLGLALLVQLAASWRRAEPGRHGLLALALVLLGSGALALQARYLEPSVLRLERPRVQAGGLSRELRIGILADLQAEEVGDHERRAISELMQARPDLILVPGDLFQRADGFAPDESQFLRVLPELRRELARLWAPLGVWAVLGNTDRPRRLVRLLEGTEIKLLHNQLRTIDGAGGRIVLGGVSRTPSPQALATIEAVGKAAGSGTLAILLTHDPGLFYRAGADPPPDLVVAGHTHGGQVRMPLVGALITLSKLPARYAAGLHRVRGAWLYTSRGIGVERGQAPRIRFLCPPEITLLRVSPAASQH
jgi:predicted MPP superfamily phosphohydrolase